MNKIPVFLKSGSKKPDLAAPADFKAEINPALLAQGIRVYESNLHPGLAKTKTRGEVVGSTRKIYRQKGTGGARHGARSAPIFVGGGIAHGPKGSKRILKLPAQMKKPILAQALTAKAGSDEVVLVEGLADFRKTNEVAGCLAKIFKSLAKKQTKITFVLAEKSAVVRALRNIPNSTVKLFGNLNPYDAFYGGLLVFDAGLFAKKVKTVKKAVKTSSKK